MKVSTLYIILFSLFFRGDIYAQIEDNTDDYVLPSDSLKVKDKLQYNFEMGVGMGFSNQLGNTFSTYYNPSLTYQVSPKFSLSSGLLYVNSSVTDNLIVGNDNYQFFSGNISAYYAYVKGQYQINDKLSVGGSVYYNFTNYNPYHDLPNNQNNLLNNQNVGYSANFRYKVAKGFTIEGEIRVNDPNNYNPFNRNQAGNYNSFFRDSYGFPYRTW